MKNQLRPLRRSELPLDTAKLAHWLVGKTLVHDHPEGRMSGRIVETEAYLIGDAAAHSFRGETARNRSLFLERGHAYVYFIYGNWYSINVTGGRAGIGTGVLLRAIEPLDGIALMTQRRPNAKLTDLARGPGRLATALRIDRRFDGLDLCSGKPPLWLAGPVHRTKRLTIGNSRRIGITQEAHRLLRFYETASPFVSGPRSLNI